LIANRGEIAVRIIRACRDVGISPIAVYSEADTQALHVRMADAAYPIGPAPAAESYLSIERILDAAGQSHADAVHPGYGFLAENAAFAQACIDASLVFVGPSPQAMRDLGLKTEARKLMQAAGVPVVPGTLDALTSIEDVRRAADEVGFPVALKAVAGGGGKGLRMVGDASQLEAAFRQAMSEAGAAFGDASVYLERAIQRPRHVEVQILADEHGQCVWLGERDCSIQRRHQKVLEESPSPAVSDELRARMGDVAVRAAQAAGYTNAGTVEFLLEPDGSFYFLEVNARLQVEHPVTELVTGLDLVELQLRVAAGQPLPLTQANVVLRGHAIEARITAEDPSRDFLPTAGRILAYDRPEPSAARVDDAIEVGTVVGTSYDSLLAKVIVHAEDRPGALRRLGRALADTTILGVTTTTGYLRGLVADPAVIAGELDTGLIERRGSPPLPIDDAGVAYAAGMLLVADSAPPAGAGDGPFARADGWRLGGRRAGSHWRMSVGGGEPVEVDVTAADVAITHRTAPGRFTIDQRGDWLLAHDGDVDWIGHNGYAWPVRRLSAAETEAAQTDGALRAPMPGQVLLVPVAVGDTVSAGDPVVVLESMKMELVLTAPIDGSVTELTVAPGDQVKLDQPLARVQENT
jgi:acetyl-CoA/propionyl-CoA carboxylase biotin carboxyl carrier protein